MYKTENGQSSEGKRSRDICIGQEKKFLLSRNDQPKQRILKAGREKGQDTPDFSLEAMKARRSWAEVIQNQREHKCQPRLLYTAKILITIDEENKIFHDKTKFTQHLSTNPDIQSIINEKLQYKEAYQNLEKSKKCPSINKTIRRQPHKNLSTYNNNNTRKKHSLFLYIS